MIRRPAESLTRVSHIHAGVDFMAKDEIVSDAATRKDDGRLVKVRLSVNRAAARKLGRVTRWEKKSQDTSLELTGRD